MPFSMSESVDKDKKIKVFFQVDTGLIFRGGSDPGQLDPDPQSLSEGGEKFNCRVARTRGRPGSNNVGFSRQYSLFNVYSRRWLLI